jgi:hypothetical protein
LLLRSAEGKPFFASILPGVFSSRGRPRGPCYTRPSVDIPWEGGAGFGGCVWLRGLFYRRKTFACIESLRWGRGGSGGEMWRRLLGLLSRLSFRFEPHPRGHPCSTEGGPPLKGGFPGPSVYFSQRVFSGRRPIFGCTKPCKVRIIILKKYNEKSTSLLPLTPAVYNIKRDPCAKTHVTLTLSM